ncbi:hypothetical protein CLV30_109173 [Haloactinopolyspora alba]|uniref:Uncharacterized protein n=1 Tax=Haloactinopolyspora alba TaxID=648780 RepID=A0A2P8E055_9ACTN|nr:hypothetical protein [Haloactinopolyspora alba]PSL02865.1 hypothetical protein CLV30_109173 [Haloactinopolyspora alba]
MASANLRSAPEGTELELHITTAEAARIAAGDTTFSAGADLDGDLVEIRVYVSEAPAPAAPIDGT